MTPEQARAQGARQAREDIAELGIIAAQRIASRMRLEGEATPYGNAYAAAVSAAPEPLTFTRVNSDACGNPRYVVHFLALNTREELDRSGDDWIPVSAKYAIATKRANTIGGSRYRAKHYGGGIVFQSYSVDETARHISEVTGRTFVAVKD